MARFSVTVHVILQEHENPNPEGRAKQDLNKVAVCQANVVELASRIAASGVKAVVVEGVYGAGSLANPEAITVDEIADTERSKAKWLLAQRSDLTVYGFELKPLNEFGIAVIGEMGKSVAQANEIAKQVGSALGPDDHERYDRFIQEEFTRLNLWYAGVIPERSFLALQTALAVALARSENAVQLVIGKQHWGDLAYAANRHPDVRIRLVPYSCY
ncbi:MAG: hypothetical protein FJ145_14270 [Deltaproteobacteria bacterium]|nr:hypothetical protein [Deltaproteobacteria bacterium]